MNFSLKQIQREIEAKNYEIFSEYNIDLTKACSQIDFPEDFINKFIDKIPINKLCRYQKLTIDIIYKYKDILNWKYISLYQNAEVLTPKVINDNIDYININDLIKNSNIRLSEDFLQKYIKKINKNNLMKNYGDFLSEEFIERNKIKLNYVIKYSKNITLDYIWKYREQINWLDLFYSIQSSKFTCDFIDKAIEEEYIYNEFDLNYRDYLTLKHRLYIYFSQRNLAEKQYNKELKKLNNIYKYENKISAYKCFFIISHINPIKIEEWFIDKYEYAPSFKKGFDYINIILNDLNFSEELLLKYIDKCNFHNNIYSLKNNSKFPIVQEQLFGFGYYNEFYDEKAYELAKKTLKNGYKIKF